MLSETGFDYNTVFHQMLPEEIEMANMALDKALKARKTKQNRG